MDEEAEEVRENRLKDAGFESSFPQTEEEANAVDDLLANELAAMSVLEQDKVMFDLHGLAAEIEETEEMIQTSLDEMEKEIQKIKKKPAFDKAIKLNPKHVRSRDLRIRFLRCEYFKCKNAAKRLVLHFEKKEMLFGDGEVLGRDVQLKDMPAQDQVYVKTGVMQVLPTRDISGRSVLAWVPGNLSREENVSPRSAQRLVYYIFDAASREEESQKKGFVVVIYNVGPKGDSPRLSILKSIHGIRLAIPHKMLGMHFCFDDKALRPLATGFKFFLDRHGRNRFRAHYGDEQKVVFQLQTYGIPFDENSPFKLENSGEFNLSWHKEWLQIRRSQEEKLNSIMAEEEPHVTIPHRFDVLFGRGKVAKQHTGNLRAFHLVDMWQKKYNEAGKYEKTIISEKIVQIIHDSGGKFLKWENGKGWIQVDDDTARGKVSHWFRHNRQKQSERNPEKSDESKNVKRPFNQ